MDIKNSNGDDIGEVQDLVIDSSGKVRYVAVQYGGFLGLGSKLFAVPFEAFKVRQDPDDPDDHDDYVLTLDVTKEQLEGDQGFNRRHLARFRGYQVHAGFGSALQRQPQPNRRAVDSVTARLIRKSRRTYFGSPNDPAGWVRWKHRA